LKAIIVAAAFAVASVVMGKADVVIRLYNVFSRLMNGLSRILYKKQQKLNRDGCTESSG